jgi:hypothetical protein
MVDGYKIQTTLPTDESSKKNYYINARAIDMLSPNIGSLPLNWGILY